MPTANGKQKLFFFLHLYFTLEPFREAVYVAFCRVISCKWPSIIFDVNSAPPRMGRKVRVQIKVRDRVGDCLRIFSCRRKAPAEIKSLQSQTQADVDQPPYIDKVS